MRECLKQTRRDHMKVVRKSFTFTRKGLRDRKNLKYFSSGVEHVRKCCKQRGRFASMSKWISSMSGRVFNN